MRSEIIRSARPARRAGFTLIELLIVMAIIGALASLAIGAVFNLREAQLKSFSETTIQKLASALDQQWKATLDQVQDDTVHSAAMALAGNDSLRGKVIFLKLRLRQEFPISFAQVLDNPIGPKPTYLPYADAFAKASLTPPPEWQSSALLYLALSQSRRGQGAFKPEEMVEPSAIQSVSAAGKEFRYFVDSWGKPLRFYTFPYYNDELNAPPYVTAHTVSTLQSADPHDPNAALLGRTWTLQSTFATRVHPLDKGLRNLVPVIASAGRDGQWGLDPQFPLLPYMAVANPDQAGDNLYSYRLRRFGARGD